MDFIQVIESLRTIKKLCQETTKCEQCRLHSKESKDSCGVSPRGSIPAQWEFDVDAEIRLPSIFK